MSVQGLYNSVVQTRLYHVKMRLYMNMAGGRIPDELIGLTSWDVPVHHDEPDPEDGRCTRLSLYEPEALRRLRRELERPTRHQEIQLLTNCHDAIKICKMMSDP
jgi:hypothetical protein